MNLDDKLREAIQDANRDFDVTKACKLDELIAQIKQAFRDEGYTQLAYNPVKKEVMGKPVVDILETTTLPLATEYRILIDLLLMAGEGDRNFVKDQLKQLSERASGIGEDK